MKRIKYSLVASAVALTSLSSMAETYTVIDLGGTADTRHSFGIGVNGLGDAVGVSRDHFNFPVDTDIINFDALAVFLVSLKGNNPGVYDAANIDDMRNGIINAEGLAAIKVYFANLLDNALIQKIGDQSAFTHVGGVTSALSLFDEFDATLNSKTRNTTDLVNAINDNGVAVSSATSLYHKINFTPEPTELVPEPVENVIYVREFMDKQGVISKGDQQVVIDPAFNTYGGTSSLTDISNSNYVVGYASVGISPGGEFGFDQDCAAMTNPVGIDNCVWSVNNELKTTGKSFYRFRAYRWKLDENLQVTEALDLGLQFTPKTDDSRNHTSIATGVNEVGHVAGYSDGYRTTDDFERDLTTRDVAIYHDGTAVKDFIDHDNYTSSRAYDINDNDLVVGYAVLRFEFPNTKQFFLYDAATDTTTYPNGFFNSSASVAHAVNNHGIVVGTAEVETSNIEFRRERGFMYDVAGKTMTDLNTLTTCDHPYTIAEARDINDDGVIVGSALLNVAKKDALGNDVLDSNGNVVMEQVSRAVKLVPVAGGVVDDCEAIETPPYERKGAGLGFIGLWLLSGLIGFRRLVR